MNELTISEDTLSFIKALASEPRMKILLLFTDGQERTVNEIKETLEFSQSTTSEHLTLMKQAGLLTSTRQGKEVFYQPNRAKILYYLDTISNLLKTCCPL